MDIALVWQPLFGWADMRLCGGDLQADAGLQTAIVASLFTDAPAQSGDEIPDGSSDPRGFWGDMPIDPAQQDVSAVRTPTGSRLWLLDGALQTDDTLTRAQHYANEALAWMITDGVADSMTTIASFPRLGWIHLVIVLDGDPNSAFTLAWQNS